MDFLALAQQCAPTVHPLTMAAVVRVESGFNPLAIGVVGGRLERQPVSKGEAVVTAKALADAGYNFSLGVGQINRYNLPKYGLNYETAFDPCLNLSAGASILSDCFGRARGRYREQQQALQAALSCYYSGNFSTGFQADFAGQPSYVQKVVGSAGGTAEAETVAPVRVIRAVQQRSATKTRTTEAYHVTVQGEGKGAASPPVVGNPTDTVMVYR